MNPFIILAIILFILMLTRIYEVLKKSSWTKHDATVEKISIIEDHNGVITLVLSFSYSDRSIFGSPVEYREEFSEITASRNSVQDWVKERRIEQGKEYTVFFNPQNPEELALHKHFTSKDHSQIVVWFSLTLISMIIAILVTRS